jgi:alkaline phosphatase D
MVRILSACAAGVAEAGAQGLSSCTSKRRPRNRAKNLSPAFDLQFFGHVAMDGKTERATVTLYDWNNVALWSKALDPR